MLFIIFATASSEPLAVLSDRENFLIEHPSMFVVSSKADIDECITDDKTKKVAQNEDKPLVVSKKYVYYILFIYRDLFACPKSQNEALLPHGTSLYHRTFNNTLYKLT